MVASKRQAADRDTHNCLVVVWALSEKCLVLDSGFARRTGVSEMCLGIVWKVSGVRDEDSKSAAGRPVAGVLCMAVRRRPVGLRAGIWTWPGCRGHAAGGGPRHTQLSGRCLGVA